MTGEDILKPLVALIVSLSVVGGAILWIARLAAAQVVASHREAVDKEADAIRADVASLRTEVAELRGAAQPALRAMDRLIGAIGGRP